MVNLPKPTRHASFSWEDPSSLRPSSQRKLLAVINAARAEFLKKGFSATSMDTIAASAKVSKRTIYKYFEDKYSLFYAVVRTLSENVIPPPLANLETSDLAPRRALTHLGIHFLSRIYSSEQVELQRVILAEARRFPELGKIMFEQVDRAERYVEEFLLSQQRAGLISLPCEHIAASQFLGLLKTDVHMRLLFGQRKRISGAEIRRIVECCLDVFFDGVANSPRPAR